jgi:F-type H+-transporting ATPase subunit epsilon
MADKASLRVTVVAVDRSVWAGEATSVVVKTVEGDMGILPGHEPVLALLKDGVVRIETADGGAVRVAVSGGFFAVDSNRVSVLAERAKLASEVDVEDTKRRLAQARDGQDSRLARELEVHIEDAAAHIR